MNPLKRLFPAYTQVDEEEAGRLSSASGNWYNTVIHPPGHQSNPATIPGFVKGILEFQTQWFGLRNQSPVSAFEVRRPRPGELRFQVSTPTKRLERKVRTHLSNAVPGVSFSEGTSGLPVTTGDSIGGGLLTPGRRDWYPLETDFDQPPMDSVASSLHHHAMKDSKILIQILFQPVIGHPFRNWWRVKRTYQRIGYLRKEKEKLWDSRPPTPRERNQANAIEDKAGTPRFHTSIRLIIIGAGEFTPSRIKELAGGFNAYENLDTGQYLNAVTVRTPLKSRIIRFAEAVANRRFGGWHRRFQASIPELAGLLTVPNSDQDNIQTAHP